MRGGSLVAVGAMVMAGCAPDVASHGGSGVDSPKPHASPLNIGGKTSPEGFTYPVVDGSPSAAAMNQAISQEVDLIRQTFIPDPGGSFDHTSYSVLRNDGLVLSVMFDGIAQPEGYKPTTFRVPMSLDVSTGNQMRLADSVVIDDKLTSAYVNAFNAQMVKDYGSTYDTSYAPWVDQAGLLDSLRSADVAEDGVLPSIQSGLTADGVVISIQLPQVFGYVQTVTLKNSDITMKHA